MRKLRSDSRALEELWIENRLSEGEKQGVQQLKVLVIRLCFSDIFALFRRIPYLFNFQVLKKSCLFPIANWILKTIIKVKF